MEFSHSLVPMLNTMGMTVVAFLAASAAEAVDAAIRVTRPVDQVHCHCGKFVALTVNKTVIDKYVLTLDKSRCSQALAEGREQMHVGFLRPGRQISDHCRSRPLLRPSPQRPSGSASDQADKFASSHLDGPRTEGGFRTAAKIARRRPWRQ
jgi:hypothetical protein